MTGDGLAAASRPPVAGGRLGHVVVREAVTRRSLPSATREYPLGPPATSDRRSPRCDAADRSTSGAARRAGATRQGSTSTALAQERSTSTTTRVTLPTATRPRSSDADTVNVSRRPSTLLEHRLGDHRGADRRRLRWSMLHAHADRRRAVGEVGGDRARSTPPRTGRRRAACRARRPCPSAGARAVSSSPTTIVASPRRPVATTTADHANGRDADVDRRHRPIAVAGTGSAEPTVACAGRPRPVIDHDVVAAGALGRGAHRRRVRRGLRRGQALHVGRPRRRSGRAGDQRARPRRRHPRGHRRHHRLRPHGRPLRARPARRGRGGRRGRPRRAAADAHGRRARRRAGSHASTRSSGTPTRCQGATRSTLLQRVDDAARVAPAPRSCRCRPATPTAASGSSSPTPTACSPTTSRCAA